MTGGEGGGEHCQRGAAASRRRGLEVPRRGRGGGSVARGGGARRRRRPAPLRLRGAEGAAVGRRGAWVRRGKGGGRDDVVNHGTRNGGRCRSRPHTAIRRYRGWPLVRRRAAATHRRRLLHVARAAAAERPRVPRPAAGAAGSRSTTATTTLPDRGSVSQWMSRGAAVLLVRASMATVACRHVAQRGPFVPQVVCKKTGAPTPPRPRPQRQRVEVAGARNPSRPATVCKYGPPTRCFPTADAASGRGTDALTVVVALLPTQPPAAAGVPLSGASAPPPIRRHHRA